MQLCNVCNVCQEKQVVSFTSWVIFPRAGSLERAIMKLGTGYIVKTLLQIFTELIPLKVTKLILLQ